MATMQPHWDIFCRVIDNYGDIGICWRLARQLASEHQYRVRLWVDDLPSLQPLCPSTSPSHSQQFIQGVEIRHWTADLIADDIADVVIEAFACDLPASYIARMAGRSPRPQWINLEYLTAENWAESCHGMASPHPSLPLVKHFFFPGFTTTTGGLLREKNLLTEHARTTESARSTLEISLFCYDTAPVGSLLDTLATSLTPVRCHVPPGKPLAAVKAHLGGSGPWQIGAARIESIPFLPLDEYDRLLRQCDINFVRGEDSFVRAQWAARPFIWQIYRQEEDAHLDKLHAFLDRYCTGLSAEVASALRDLHLAWNTDRPLPPAWNNFLQQRAAIVSHNAHWRDNLAKQPDLASALVKFCAAKV